MLVGNLFAYFQFRGLDSIDRVTRLQTIGGLFASTVAGCLLFIVLLPRTNLSKYVMPKQVWEILLLLNLSTWTCLGDA